MKTGQAQRAGGGQDPSIKQSQFVNVNIVFVFPFFLVGLRELA